MVGFARREACAFDGDPHGLFLEKGDAQCLAQDLFQFGAGIDDFFLPLAPAQIGMHHVALDGTRPDNRHFDDQIVKRAGLTQAQETAEARISGPVLRINQQLGAVRQVQPATDNQAQTSRFGGFMRTHNACQRVQVCNS